LKHKYRIRRGATALLIGVGAVAGSVALAGGTAFAATSTIGARASLTATSTTTLVANGTNQAAGNWTLTLPAGSTWAAGDSIKIAVGLANAAAGATIAFDHTPSVVPANTTGATEAQFSSVTTTGDTLTLTFGNSGSASSTANETVAIGTTNDVAYDITGATPTSTTPVALTVTATYSGSVGTGTAGTSGNIATGAAINGTFTSAPTMNVTALSTPSVGLGLASQAAGNLAVTLSNPNSASNLSWTSGQSVVIETNDTSNVNCTANGAGKPETVSLSAVPTATVSDNSSSVSTAPTVSVALGATNGTNGTPACTTYGGVDNELIVTFTNSGTLTGASLVTNPAATILLSGISYTIGTGAATGPLAITADYAGIPTTQVNGTAETDDTAGSSTPGPSNASVSEVVVTANSPAVAVPAGSIDSAISPVTITEAAPGAIPQGEVCVALSSGTFDKAATPAVAVTTGNATVGSTVSGSGTNTLSFAVTGTSTTASTITLSKLAVDALSTATGAVTATVTDGASSTCTGGTPIGNVTLYTVGGVARIAGSTADGTAAAELYSQFNYARDICPGTIGARSVVLATDTTYPDALAASYLAGRLGTGILLTPIDSVSPATLSALQLEGITQVYVVGGPYVVSAADVAQLKATPSYHCEGTTVRQSLLGTNEDLQVTQIYGQTEYGTAADIATYFGSSGVANLSIAGAYGKYNTTTGTASSGPATTNALRTAILATSNTFQDAESASAVADALHAPILITAANALSPQAQSGLQGLGIQQVIVMGGPIAISNSVVTSLQGLGMSVIRIAGTDYTQTATELADFEVNSTTGGLGLGWNPHGKVVVARGDFYSDGLAGAVVTGRTETPLLLTENPTTVGQYLTAFLGQAGTAGIDGLGSTTPGDVIHSLTVLGGPLAVTPTTVSALQSALGG
jgi:putative cell wall-binding protein